jgi:hypothetical protein
MAEETKVEPKKGIVLVCKDEIRVVCPKHKSDEPLASTKGQNLNEDKALNIDAGTKNCRWCKKGEQEVSWPDIQARIFEE